MEVGFAISFNCRNNGALDRKVFPYINDYANGYFFTMIIFFILWRKDVISFRDLIFYPIELQSVLDERFGFDFDRCLSKKKLESLLCWCLQWLLSKIEIHWVFFQYFNVSVLFFFVFLVCSLPFICFIYLNVWIWMSGSKRNKKS